MWCARVCSRNLYNEEDHGYEGCRAMGEEGGGGGWKSVFRYVPATYVQRSPRPKSHFGHRPRKSTEKNKFVGEVCFTDYVLNWLFLTTIPY